MFTQQIDAAQLGYRNVEQNDVFVDFVYLFYLLARMMNDSLARTGTHIEFGNGISNDNKSLRRRR